MKKVERKQRRLENTGSELERSKLQNEIKEDKEKFAEEINVKLGIRIGLNPELSAQVELNDINQNNVCCLIS